MMPRGGGGRLRKREPNLGMPQRGGPVVDPGFNVGPQPGPGGGLPPDRNGAQRGLGYGMGLAQGMGGRFAGPSPGTQPGGMPQPPSPWGAGNAYDSGDTMQRTARNEYLNTLAVGGPREQAMNQMGYWNGGTPFDPTSVRGTGINRFNRQNANANAQTGDFSAAGTYQMMDPGNHGYIGMTQVGDDGSAQYNPLAPRGRTRRTRTFGQVM